MIIIIKKQYNSLSYDTMVNLPHLNYTFFTVEKSDAVEVGDNEFKMDILLILC